MSNYGWTNADGEPIMDGAAYRYEQYLDSTYEYDYDSFFDNEPAEDYDECPECEGDIDPTDGRCFDCGAGGYTAEDEGGEDRWLDSYMEDRISVMYE